MSITNLFEYLPGSPQPYKTLADFHKKVDSIKQQIDAVVMPYKSGSYAKIKNTPGAIIVARKTFGGWARQNCWTMSMVSSGGSSVSYWTSWVERKCIDIRLMACNSLGGPNGMHNAFTLEICKMQGVNMDTRSVVYFIDCDLKPILKEIEDTIKEVYFG